MPQNLSWDGAKHALSAAVALGLSFWVSLHFAVQALIALQALDVVTGVLAAWAGAKVDSSTGWDKLSKKVITWVLVAGVGFLAPALGGVSITVPALGDLGPVEALALYYAAMEAISIVENAGKAGVKFPAPITARLKQLGAGSPEKTDEPAA